MSLRSAGPAHNLKSKMLYPTGVFSSRPLPSSASNVVRAGYKLDIRLSTRASAFRLQDLKADGPLPARSGHLLLWLLLRKKGANPDRLALQSRRVRKLAFRALLAHARRCAMRIENVRKRQPRMQDSSAASRSTAASTGLTILLARKSRKPGIPLDR